MRARLVDLTISRAGKQRLTLELDGDFREGYDELIEHDVDVHIKRWRAHRSKDANAYLHALINEIATRRGVSDDEVKRELVVQYGTIALDSEGDPLVIRLPVDIDPDRFYAYTRCIDQRCEDDKIVNIYALYKRSSDMTSAEFSRLVDGAITEARELGIDTDTPQEAARLKAF